MDVQRIRELRAKQSRIIRDLCQRRDAEIRIYGAARESTARALILAEDALELHEAALRAGQELGA